MDARKATQKCCCGPCGERFYTLSVNSIGPFILPGMKEDATYWIECPAHCEFKIDNVFKGYWPQFWN